MAGNLRPADLGASRNLNQGAPIVRGETKQEPANERSHNEAEAEPEAKAEPEKPARAGL